MKSEEFMSLLENVRTPEKRYSVKKQIAVTTGILLIGILLGTFSKFLDYRQAELPSFIRWVDSVLDLHNFLGVFAPWIIIAVYISVKSDTPLRAGINVFTFFVGMVTSYYLYSKFVAGFFPRSYAMIWGALNLISPVLAFICWYAKGKGWVSLIISSGILAFIINCTLSYGMWYVDIPSLLHLVMLILGIVILRRSIKETVCIIGISVPFAIILKMIIPFWI